MKQSKYLRGTNGFIIWDNLIGITHKRMAQVTRTDGEILSAGFLQWINGKPYCYGGSETLGIESLPEDTTLLEKQFDIE